jgi:hypothetical protein
MFTTKISKHSEKGCKENATERLLRERANDYANQVSEENRLSSEKAENNVCALLFCQVRDEVKDLGSSDEESFAVAVVRGFFIDVGYTEEQTENRLAAVLKAARRCL